MATSELRIAPKAPRVAVYDNENNDARLLQELEAKQHSRIDTTEQARLDAIARLVNIPASVKTPVFVQGQRKKAMESMKTAIMTNYDKHEYGVDPEQYRDKVDPFKDPLPYKPKHQKTDSEIVTDELYDKIKQDQALKQMERAKKREQKESNTSNGNDNDTTNGNDNITNGGDDSKELASIIIPNGDANGDDQRKRRASIIVDGQRFEVDDNFKRELRKTIEADIMKKYHKTLKEKVDMTESKYKDIITKLRKDIKNLTKELQKLQSIRESKLQLLNKTSNEINSLREIIKNYCSK